MKVAAILLAAGQGTRMKSDLPKVLHPLCGKPMLWHVLEAVKTVIHREAGRDRGPRRGTGESVCRVTPPIASCRSRNWERRMPPCRLSPCSKGNRIMSSSLYADMPLLRGETFQRLVETQQANPGPFSLLTVMAQMTRAALGGSCAGQTGQVQAIVEEYVATPEQLDIHELNVGAYCFRSEWLWEALHRIQKNPQKGEYYLTDVVELAVKDNLPVQAVVHDDLIETIGINTRVHLAEAEAAMRQRINRAHMLNGVSMTDPASTYIEAGVTIGKDTLIMPNTYIHGKTVIGEGEYHRPEYHHP